MRKSTEARVKVEVSKALKSGKSFKRVSLGKAVKGVRKVKLAAPSMFGEELLSPIPPFVWCCILPLSFLGKK